MYTAHGSPCTVEPQLSAPQNIRLPGLSGIHLHDILINAHAACTVKMQSLHNGYCSCYSLLLVLLIVPGKKMWVLTLEKKLSILDRLKSGEMQEKLAIEYGIGGSMIGDIKKTQDKLKSFASTVESFAMSSAQPLLFC